MSATQAGDPREGAPHAVSRIERPASDRLAKLRLHVTNVLRLVIKELRSFRSDPIMLALVAYSFTFAIYAAATGASTEATNLSIGIVDEDRSDLSRRIADGLTPPTFKKVTQIAATEIDAIMNSQRAIFVIEIPTKFQADILAGRRPTVPPSAGRRGSRRRRTRSPVPATSRMGACRTSSKPRPTPTRPRAR